MLTEYLNDAIRSATKRDNVRPIMLKLSSLDMRDLADEMKTTGNRQLMSYCGIPVDPTSQKSYLVTNNGPHRI